MIFEKETKFYKSFFISFCLILAVALSGVFLGIHIESQNLIFESLRANARTYFETIVATRAWNAGYGGVYVEKKAGVQSNPYIDNPDIETKDGRIFTIRNPAMMTREVSEYLGKDKNFSFHITSKKLVNPNNAPDAFEREALDSFETGMKEQFSTEIKDGKAYFRYMGPLLVKQDCLKCHDRQGYRVGDVRGGISVAFNIDEVYRRLHRNGLFIFMFAVSTTGLLVTAFWYLSRRLMRKVVEIRQRIEALAITDGLTGIFNRRHVLSRFQEEFERTGRQHRELACLMLDIDHFKSVNDRFGHLVGDQVLEEVASRVRNTIRKYDVLGRYGGEEFLVVMPDSTLEEAENLADRIRRGIEASPMKDVVVTVSIGAADSRDDDKVIEDVIRRADEALYEAKKAGRNCVRSRIP